MTQVRGSHEEFFWRGTDATQWGALVAWSAVCRPISHGGLGIRHLQHTNTASLSKWVIRVMMPSSDMVSILLRELFGQSLNWSVWATSRQGDSPVVAGLRGIFSLVRPFFRLQLRDGAHFRFWKDDWSDLGRFSPPQRPSTRPDSLNPNNVDWHVDSVCVICKWVKCTCNRLDQLMEYSTKVGNENWIKI